MPIPHCKGTSQGACTPSFGGAETTSVSKGKSLNLSVALTSSDQSTEDKGRQEVKALNDQNPQNWSAKKEFSDLLIEKN